MHNVPRVLCVDDDPSVLTVLARMLSPRFDVRCASGARDALEHVARADAPLAVIISDLHMPAMNGIELLREARQLAPSTIRILLTGHADTACAIEAVNDGAVFRFLTKPCPWETFVDAVVAAAEQYRVAEAERVLSEQTLHGAVRALTDVLTAAAPAAFARAVRLERYVGPVAATLALENCREIEVAALLSQLGCVAVPRELAERQRGGVPSEAADAAAVELPGAAAALIEAIPQLERVREMLRELARAMSPAEMSPGARILRTALALDTLLETGMSLTDAHRALEQDGEAHDAMVLDAFWRTLSGTAPASQRVLRLRDVREGMVFVADVTGPRGLVLASRGEAVGPAFLRRLRYVWTNALLDAEVRVVEQSAI